MYGRLRSIYTRNSAAVLIVGGTIAEDVITGGGGIADDAASFYLAYRLMFGL